LIDRQEEDMQDADTGTTRVVGPEGGSSYWQPMPANGHVRCIVDAVAVGARAGFGFGTQTVPPGGYVREHAHDRHEEILHFIAGSGLIVLDGGAEEHVAEPGVTVYVGRGRRHKFINTGTAELHWTWLLLPQGLEDFFAAIGRPRQPGEPAPEPFPRPADVLAIEARTVFAPQSQP
jgi:mannose-6-phosphate isomerase-like protein (cupin superfamily)